MNEHIPRAAPDAYAVDVAAWTKRQVELMRLRRFEALNLDNIIEEIESLGNEQEHAVESHLIRIAEHLLKLHVSEDAERLAANCSGIASTAGTAATQKPFAPSVDP